MPAWEIVLDSALATLRERAFVHLTQFVQYGGHIVLKRFGSWGGNVLDLSGEDTVQEKLLLCGRRYGDLFTQIPLTTPTMLCEGLQDLADIIAWEATRAFTEEYYPGVIGMVMPQEHVEVVMAAMQREMDSEGNRRGKAPTVFASLSPARQRALAERRRYWFGQYGITTENWHKGTWSLWEVADTLMPNIRIGG